MLNVRVVTKAKCPGAKTPGESGLRRNVLIHHDMAYMQIVCF